MPASHPSTPAAAGDAWHRLQGVDRAGLGAPHLYLAQNDEASRAWHDHGLTLAADDWLGGGTLRNSLYVAPWLELTRVRSLALQVEARGSLRLRVMRASAGRPAELLKEQHLVSRQRQTHVVPLGSLSAWPADSRLFWHLDAVDDSQVHEVNWCTREVPATGTRLAVLMRTWGRTADLQAQLRRFADAAALDTWHARVLSHCSFWVLDASPQAAALWPDTPAPGLDLRVLQGPNLGGGGNASHLMAQFLAACDAEPEQTPTDVLLLDDDAIVSMESLARHFVACSLREVPHISTLPVLQRSRPDTVWEDGGYWGRLNFQLNGELGCRRNLFPHLLKHGLALAGYDHLDAFGPLNRCEYATFIFFGLPMAVLRRIGLPAAFFLRGDDIEYSLRAQAQGVPVVSNPNLAAWHEPGHSYPQEYMAILHAVLINFRHSDGGAADLVAWFEQRFAEHAALGDLEGMKLYLGVLDSVLDSQSSLLTPDFAQHYAQRLPALAAIASHKLPQAERQRVEREASAQGALLLPFVYPGFHPATGPRRTVLLCNAGAGSYREVPPCAPAERLALHRQALERLEALSRSFDALQAFWCERLARAGTLAFWEQVRQAQAEQTRLLLRQLPARPVPAPADAAAAHIGADTPAEHDASPLASVPVRELRRRIEGQLADLARLRREAQGRPAAARRADQPWWRRWWPGRRTPRPVPTTSAALPPDFDPAGYLQLNADVARTGMDARQHYLRYGRAEGRRYRA